MELKPCPNELCKSKNCSLEWDVGSLTTYYVKCRDCGINSWSTRKDTEAEAIAAWNHRPIEDELRGRIKELEEGNKNCTEWLRKYLKIIEDLKAEKAEKEQWQKEAVEMLVGYQRTLSGFLDRCANPEDANRLIEELTTLIKQAGKHGKE